MVKFHSGHSFLLMQLNQDEGLNYAGSFFDVGRPGGDRARSSDMLFASE